MLKFLVRKANGLLQTHLGGGEPQERGTGLSPYFFFGYPAREQLLRTCGYFLDTLSQTGGRRGFLNP